MIRLIFGTMISLKSAVMLIIILTILAVTGTLLPQNLEAAKYLSAYPKTGHLILAFGFDDMYHSVAFQTALWLLSISALLCVCTRWQVIKRRLFKRLEDITADEIRAMPVSKSIGRSLKPDWLDSFQKYKSTENGVRIYYKPSGRLSLMGSMFIHIGLLVVLAGGLAGVYYGIETFIHGAKGEKVAIPSLEAVRAAKSADQTARKARSIRTFNPNDPRLEGMRTQVEALQKQYYAGLASPSFKICFDELWVENYESPDGQVSGVKSWNSKIRFIDSDSENSSEPLTIRVNQPLSHKEYTFYQASWSKNYRKIKILAAPHSNAAGSASQTIELSVGEPVDFSAVSASLGINSEVASQSIVKIELAEFFSDFHIVDKRFVNMSRELLNPAAMIIGYNSQGEPAGRAWAFPADKMALAEHVSNMPFMFTFLDAEPEYESGLQMTHDPGKPFVWLGCLLFSLGMIMSFYISCIEKWAVLYPDGNVFIAVSGNRPENMLALHLQDLETTLRTDEH